jgi:hypothetical protein
MLGQRLGTGDKKKLLISGSQVRALVRPPIKSNTYLEVRAVGDALKGRGVTRGVTSGHLPIEIPALRPAGTPDDVKIQPWQLHDLHRTVVTGMARAGADLNVIERAVNPVSGSLGGYPGLSVAPLCRRSARRAGVGLPSDP